VLTPLPNSNQATTIVNAIPIDNGVIGYPYVTCSEHGIGVKVETEKKFAGRVFVKNEVHRPECVWPRPVAPGIRTRMCTPHT
jgi:hypothetical protein